MTTRRGARSTSTPDRASRYSGTPSRFSAEYIGGTCSISPTNRLAAAAIRAGAGGGSLRAGPRSSPLPRRRWSSPSRASRRRDRSCAPRACRPRAASRAPKKIGSMPVASGSRLPVCPALAAANKRLARCNARFDDMPSGLSSKSSPNTSRLGGRAPRHVRRGSVGAGARASGVVDELAELDGTSSARVVAKPQLRNAPQLQSARARASGRSRALARTLP